MEWLHIGCSVDSRQGGPIGMLEGWASVCGGLDKLEEWIGRKLVIFHKDKYKLMHLGRNKPLYNTSWGLTA